MEEFVKFENLIDHTRDYVNTRIDEAKLTLAEKTSAVLARMIAAIAVNLVFLLSLLFASLAAGWWLGARLGSPWLGYLAVAIFYFVLGWLVWAMRERLIRIPIMNAFIHQLFKNDNDEED